MTTATRMTADEYFAISVEGDKTQLVDGVMVVDDPRLLHNASQVAILLDEHNVFGPDVLWLADENVPDRLDKPIQGLPDLAVEIRSPSTWRYDIGKKRAAYERAGQRELWLVDTASRTVIVCRGSVADAPSFDIELELSETDELTSPRLPGFSLPVGRVFTR